MKPLRFLSDIWWFMNHWKIHVDVYCDTPGSYWRLAKIRRWMIDSRADERTEEEI